ncbi:MAG: PAAR domain-containing protein [Pseudomonadota bacterium]
MGMPGCIKGDMVLQTPPAHCHQPHPMGPAQVPVPVPPAPPLKMNTSASKVKLCGKEACRVGDKTINCTLPGCPKPDGGPGEVALGSFTVKIEGKFAARFGDMTKHPGCVGPIPAPVGKVLGPGAATVMIG